MSALTEKDEYKLRSLIARSVSDGLDTQDASQLRSMLRHSRQARQYYMECLGLYTDLYDVMGHYPEMESPCPSLRRKRMIRVYAAALLSTAAVVVVVLWFAFSARPLGPEVAALVDFMDVSASRRFPTERGESLHLGQGRHVLKRGLVHIRFGQGVDVVLEGPSTFEIMSATELSLIKGRVFVSVEESGQGFQVSTTHADFVDLGTQFGVMIDSARGTQLFVIKGEVEVHTDTLAQAGNVPVYKDEEAVQILGQGRTVISQTFNDQLFVRQIDSHTGMVWRGERALDLADLVTGGNGFGSGEPGSEIDPLTGEFRTIKSPASDRAGDYQYHKVPALPCVDGVFVPDGDRGPVQVTSEGHLFEECPDTSHIYFSEILGCSMASKGPMAGRSTQSLILNGVAYGEKDRPSIFMHANLGLTFDLGAIRQGFASSRVIQQFESIVGISEDTNESQLGDADVYVLIDGRLVWSRRNMRVGQTRYMTVPIPSESQFLTLITTDSHSRITRADTFADWCVFGNPRLILE
ncbi:MAG: hypothetical protein GY809_13105 [Planctomycetes bacterium]|nr:hypothetical protein [Planctomycetota bacterium]